MRAKPGLERDGVHDAQNGPQGQPRQLAADAAARGRAVIAHSSKNFEQKLGILTCDCFPYAFVAPSPCKGGDEGLLLQAQRKVIAARS